MNTFSTKLHLVTIAVVYCIYCIMINDHKLKCNLSYVSLFDNIYFYIVLVERWERTRKIQPLLAPKPLVLTPVHELALDDHRTVIEKLGFSFIHNPNGLFLYFTVQYEYIQYSISMYVTVNYIICFHH